MVDGIGVAVDQLPAVANFFVYARDTGRERGKVAARAQLRTIMFDLDKSDELIIAINCDPIDRDDCAILIFCGGVVERLQRFGSTLSKWTERVAQSDVVAICK